MKNKRMMITIDEKSFELIEKARTQQQRSRASFIRFASVKLAEEILGEYGAATA